ncbi:MAG: hypothetical protein ACK5JH_14380 [Anaerocolumna sp.]
MSKVIGILDGDIQYSKRLMEYIKRKRRTLFQVRVFSDLNNMQKYLEHNQLDILLLGEELYPLEGKDYSSIFTIILRENDKKNTSTTELGIYKYQPVSILIDELTILCPMLKEDEADKNVENVLKIVAVTSLEDGSMGEIFSYLLAKEYGHKEKVLFLNLVPFTGLRETLPEDVNQGMSELIYYMNEKVDTIDEKLNTIIKSNERMDYISNVTFLTDLNELTIDGMRVLLKTIKEYARYTYCIIHVGILNATILELLRKCHKTYILSGTTNVANRRKDNLIKQLEWADFHDILKNLIPIGFTDEERDYIFRAYEERIEDEGLKDFIRNFIKMS